FRSLLEFEYKKKERDLDGKRVGFGSYGSGSSAMVFSGVIQPEHKEIVKQMDLEQEIGQRVRLSMEEYERLHENERNPDDSIINPHKEFILMRVGGSTDDLAGFREYSYAS
ncbi:MAG: 3-hydroxy-3-methylglutaryl-CoA synthase, partial [Thermoproteota archaeon]|nr:3-hydroxy-3-methylglutaryl-CoA synthase [Thermoproteota archaeon]